MNYQDQIDALFAVWLSDCVEDGLPVYLLEEDSERRDVFLSLGFENVSVLQVLPCCKVGQALFCREGNLFPCPQFVEEDSILGTVGKDGTLRGKNVMLAIKLLKFNPGDSSLKCGSCKRTKICAKDRCFYEAYTKMGDMFYPVCEMTE